MSQKDRQLLIIIRIIDKKCRELDKLGVQIKLTVVTWYIKCPTSTTALRLEAAKGQTMSISMGNTLIAIPIIADD